MTSKIKFDIIQNDTKLTTALDFEETNEFLAQLALSYKSTDNIVIRTSHIKGHEIRPIIRVHHTISLSGIVYHLQDYKDNCAVSLHIKNILNTYSKIGTEVLESVALAIAENDLSLVIIQQYKSVSFYIDKFMF